MSNTLFDKAKALSSKVANLLPGRKTKKAVSPAEFRRGEAAKKQTINVKSAPAKEGTTAARRATKRYADDHAIKPTKRVKNAQAKASRLNSTGTSSRKRTRQHPPTKGR